MSGFNPIPFTSIPLDGGGDTHIHPYGHNENDFVITTRIPLGNGLNLDFHDNPFIDKSDFNIKD